LKPHEELAALDAIAFSASEAGEYTEARGAFDEIIARKPGDATPLVHRAWSFLRAGLRAEAERDVAEALLLAPSHAEAKTLHGQLHGGPR
jgi:Flp pilus assembly protein TadD